MCTADAGAPGGRSVKRRRRDQQTAAADAFPLACPGQQMQQQQLEQVVDLSSAPTTVKRSSRFRGVSRHRWTGRFEAHLWDKLSWNIAQKKKGKQGTRKWLPNQLRYTV